MLERPRVFGVDRRKASRRSGDDVEDLRSRLAVAERERDQAREVRDRLLIEMERRLAEAVEALEQIVALQKRWDAPVASTDVEMSNAGWAAVGSEAHKIATDASARGDSPVEPTQYGWAHADDHSPCMEPVWCKRDHVRTPKLTDVRPGREEER